MKNRKERMRNQNRILKEILRASFVEKWESIGSVETAQRVKMSITAMLPYTHKTC